MLALLVAAHYYYSMVELCTVDPEVTVPWILSDEKRSFNVSSCNVFSDSYWIARNRFRAAAEAARVPVTPLTVHQVETSKYTMDIAVIRGKLPGVVVHVSGTHGVEGYAGSAIQVAFLEALHNNSDDHLNELCTVVLVHAFNPFGMDNYRRANEHNVDLNRNGLIRRTDDPDDDAVWQAATKQHWNARNYDKFHSLFNPSKFIWWDAYFFSWWDAFKAVLIHGVLKLQTAMVGAQYHVPHGILYGGSRTEPSLLLLRDWMVTFLKEHLTGSNGAAITWIDVHTGLGWMGEDALLPSSACVETADLQFWFPESSENDFSTVANGYERAMGLTTDYYQHHVGLLSDSNNLFFVQEFGTLHASISGHALIVENAAYHDSTLTAEQQRDLAKQTLGPAFYPARTKWRFDVLQRGLRCLQQAVQRSVKLSSAVEVPAVAEHATEEDMTSDKVLIEEDTTSDEVPMEKVTMSDEVPIEEDLTGDEISMEDDIKSEL